QAVQHSERRAVPPGLDVAGSRRRPAHRDRELIASTVYIDFFPDHDARRIDAIQARVRSEAVWSVRQGLSIEVDLSRHPDDRMSRHLSHDVVGVIQCTDAREEIRSECREDMRADGEHYLEEVEEVADHHTGAVDRGATGRRVGGKTRRERDTGNSLCSEDGPRDAFGIIYGTHETSRCYDTHNHGGGAA